MAKWYAETKTCKREYQTIDTSDCDKPKDNKCSIKVVFGKLKNGFGVEYDDVKWYCMNLIPSVKIDSRCSSGYNPVALRTFKATYEKGKPSSFRLWAKIDDYYNYEYSTARATVYSVHLDDDDNNSVAGYITKDSDDGKKLFEYLKDGKVHPLILELEYGRSSQDSSVVGITKFLQDGWRTYPGEP